jgi:eukaryotic-like serine/threonine-protein kinase
MTISAGTRFGPYEIVDAIGAGGMGEVWRARDTRLGRDVALKFLPAHFASNEQLLSRFEREARVISSLSHPNICTLHDVGEQDGRHYLVMELIEGESLADRLTRGPLPLLQVLKYGAQIASALDKAHRQGITHRDLKPGNVMLTKSDAKLLDFGLARAATASDPTPGLTDLPTAAKPLTEEGTILGTFQYMAPEQLEGQEAGPRTDIFALGTLLYEMATGRRAFEGKTRTSLIAAIVSSQPAPVSSLVDVAPPALDHVIRQCLEKDPEDRWQSAHDVAGQLQWISEAGSQAGVPAPIAGSRRTGRRVMGIAIATLALLSAVLGWLVFRAPEPAAPAEQISLRIELPEGFSPGRSISVSPDGRMVAFVLDGPETGDDMLWVRALDEFEARPVPGTEGGGGGGLIWSPDSKEIAFGANMALRRVPIEGGVPVTICPLPVIDGAWSSDGVILFTSLWGEGLQKVSAAGGEAVPFTTLDKEKKESVHRSPRFFEDGKHFAFFGRAAHGLNSEIYLATIDDPTPRRIVSADSLQSVLPGNVIVYARAGRVLAQRVDLATASPVGDPVALVDRVMFSSPGAEASFSATGDVMAYRLPELVQHVLRWRDRDGTLLGDTGFRGSFGGDLAFGGRATLQLSPDARSVLVAKESDRGVGTDLWALEFERRLETRLTTQPGEDFGAGWSPDGRRIALVSDKVGLFDIYLATTDGAREPELLLGAEVPFDKYATAFTPDGKSLLIGTFRPDTGGDVHLLDIETRELRDLVATKFNEFPRAISPDGEWFAYASDQSGRMEIYIQRLDGRGSRVQVSTERGITAHWIGDEIIFYGGNALWAARAVLSGDTARIAAPVKLRDNIPSVVASDTVDGRRFLTIERVDERMVPAPIHVVVNWMPPALRGR